MQERFRAPMCTLLSVDLTKHEHYYHELMRRLCMSRYTPEVYPTSVRATGIGMSSSAARIGGLATPYVAQVLMTMSLYATVSVYSITAFLAGILALTLPIETRGRELHDSIEQETTDEKMHSKVSLCCHLQWRLRER